MRIHRLRMSAFGPFAGTEDVDFDRLGSHGLFLLNGATGAGKTSVLDAICFALYGSVPGARQDGKRLRSDHADPGQEPSVTCEFSAQGRYFEVSRSPAWDKPSARGKNGFTTQQAKTLLRERVDGSWEEKSGRNDEAGAEITGLLSMDREQFTRVVMLPQGDFAAFLRSKATERTDLLQKLFGTQRFESVERELAERAGAARQAVERINAQIDLLGARARTESESLLTDDVQLPDDPSEQVDFLLATAHAQETKSAAASTMAEQRNRDLQSQVERLTARAARDDNLLALRERQLAADAQAEMLVTAAERMAAHHRAARLSGELSAVDAAQVAAERAADDRADALGLLRMAVQDDAELAEAASSSGDVDIPAERSRLRSTLAVVEARIPDEDRLVALGSEEQTHRVQLTLLSEKRVTFETSVARLRLELAAVTVRSGELRDAAADLALRLKEATAAADLVRVVGQYRAANVLTEEIQERHRQATDTYLGARTRWLDLREERLQNAAAELAGQLVDGQACAVCGSLEHPDPPTSAFLVLDLAQQEQDAQDASERAEKIVATVGAELSEAQQNRAALAGQGGTADPAEAESAAAAAKVAADGAQAAAQELGLLDNHQERLSEELEAAEATLAAHGDDYLTAKTSLMSVTTQQQALVESLAPLRAGHASLEHRIRAINSSLSSLEAAHTATMQAEKATAQSVHALERLTQALPDSGFTHADDARAALLADPEPADLQDILRRGHDEQARLAELWESADIQLAVAEQEQGLHVSVHDIELARFQAAEAARENSAAGLGAGLAVRRCEVLQSVARDMALALDSARAPRRHAEMLTGVAEAAAGRGENSFRMSLNSYVLAARLEQVATAASERLVAMSDGRYLLQHTDAKAARGAKSGLGLQVVDQWTGHQRDTSTLSGGESFMAALSLALGLADVVQQEAGGVEIETLFVDEGFGSLDEQALEQVMDALENLRDGGRVVGLVSHVAEMKQRIGTQLQVIKGRHGSTLEISENLVS